MIIETFMPLYIEIGKRKHHINLNNYRNWHYQLSNNIKKEYKSVVTNKLRRFDGIKFDTIEIEFTMHRGDTRKVDRSNVLSIHEKFFCDALVELGFLPDDNDNYILKTTYITGDVRKLTPGIAIKIINLQ